MKNRIFTLIDNLQLTSTEFADTIGVSRAAISSIKTGRTQPTLMLVEKIKEHFPKININWLIFGEGDMFQVDYIKPKMDHDTRQDDLFDMQSDPTLNIHSNMGLNQMSSGDKQEEEKENIDVINHNENNINKLPNKKRYVTKVILLYNDGTFADFDQ